MTSGFSNTLTISLIVTIMASTCFFACSSEKEISLTTEDYYLNHLKFAGTGVVYRYKSVKDPSLPDEIWHYRFSGGYQGNFLMATMYTPSGEVVQRSIERLSRQKAELLSLDLVYMDEQVTKEIATTISENDTFIFGPIDSATQTVYHIAYWDTTEDSVRVSLTKQRMMEGTSEYLFNGKVIPAIQVSTKETLETETEGFTETEWSGIEIFGEGLGLVFYSKSISEQFNLEYELVEIMDYSLFATQHSIQNNNLNHE